MERLTWKRDLDGYTDVGLRDGVSVGDAICQLADYEDTGMEPEEITTNPYGCVFYCNRKCNLDDDFCIEGPGCPHEVDTETAKHLLEISQAEKDGRMVVLPTNAPLTLDELREMDGEPVFIRNTEYCDCWALVQVANKIMFTLNNGAMVPAELEFKCGGKAYRRKPEEEEKHGRMD